MDIAIVNGTVIDGTGAPRVRADVGITDDRIATVGTLDGTAGRTIDATGRIVAPGFIDVHAHSDFVLLREPFNPEKVMQGVTTNIIGNCALSPAPVNDTVRMFFEHLLQHVFGTIKVTWDSFDSFLRVYEDQGIGPNVKSLAGLGTVRMHAMGMENRPPTDRELGQMRRHVADAMEAGAVGVSTGLVYPPGSFAQTEEIIHLAKVAAEYGGLYATHMRNEEAGLLEAVDEALRIGEEADLPVQISHHKASGEQNWGLVHESLARLDAARARGVDASSDVYPYTAFSTILGPFIDRFEQSIEANAETKILIVGTRFDKSLEGRYIQDIAQERGQSSLECARDINNTEEGAVTIVGFAMSEDDIETVMRHPQTMIGSDGMETDVGTPHPRAYGTFPRVLGRYARERGVLSLEAAVHKMTAQSAAQFRLTDRGTVTPGAFADLVVFDPEAIIDTATYEAPRQHPRGIDCVLINGRVAVAGGEAQDVRPGRVLRHNVGQ